MNEVVDMIADDSEVQSAEQLAAQVLAYDPSVDVDLIKSAYAHCKSAHGTQTRHSGEPYYGHPVAVAGILASLHMDVQSVCTALLHDVLEDTDTSYEDLVLMFGEEIAELVDGVTKLGKAKLSSPDAPRERRQAENFQKFVLAMSRDIRVLIVKLCDRLHNMRTLDFHPKEASRRRIATETLDIYAPLARRIGVDRIVTELEDLSFKHLQPDVYQNITKRLGAWRAGQDVAISQMSVAIRDLMDREKVPAKVYGREKRAYAIWRKLDRQGITFEDVADIYAFRIIVDDVETCYRVIGILHTNFRCVPSRFRDFISVPKPNGYQSVHTTILGTDNTRMEIQIRTARMEDIAERGVAAHWTYKNQSYAYDPESAKDSGGDPLRRVRPLVEMMEQSGDADEFLEHAKMEMFADQVFAFTPKGDLIALPKGATSLDFAYALHTDIGDTCIGAIINSRQRPLRTRLQNLDVVKIIRGGEPEAQPGWENMVVTGKARAALRRLTREGEDQEFIQAGAMMVEHAFARKKMDFSESSLKDALTRLPYKKVPEIFKALGDGSLPITELMKAVFPGDVPDNLLEDYANREFISDDTATLYVKGDGLRPGVSLHFADCCSPIPGDRIVGIQAKGKGTVIHTIDCDMLAEAEGGGAEWLDIGWRRTAEHAASTARIIATLEHVPGALADVTRIIGNAAGNLTSIKTVKRSSTFFDMIMVVDVRDKRHLSQIIAAMRASIYVVSAQRAHSDFADVED